jgi:hypothetical protein
MTTLNKGRLLAWLIFCSSWFCTSCERSLPYYKFPPYDKDRASSKAMDLYDTNRDGKISGTELDQVPGLKASLEIFHANKAQGITKKHIADRLQDWNDSHIGRIFLKCMVMHNGQALEGATVNFVPEKFLADDLKDTPTGITDPSGIAIISLPTTPGPEGDPPGLAPGFYRIEITKEGENIPNKYNTATELGQEVSLDNPEIHINVVKFDLKY